MSRKVPVLLSVSEPEGSVWSNLLCVDQPLLCGHMSGLPWGRSSDHARGYSHEPTCWESKSQAVAGRLGQQQQTPEGMVPSARTGRHQLAEILRQPHLHPLCLSLSTTPLCKWGNSTFHATPSHQIAILNSRAEQVRPVSCLWLLLSELCAKENVTSRRNVTFWRRLCRGWTENLPSQSSALFLSCCSLSQEKNAVGEGAVKQEGEGRASFFWGAECGVWVSGPCAQPPLPAQPPGASSLHMSVAQSSP